jgi:hypothetical protein
MPRESRAARQGLQAVVYRYFVPGPLPEAVTSEIRRAHVLRNKITEAYREADEAVAGIYADDPGVAAAAETADAAADLVRQLRGQVQARKSEGRTRVPDPQLAAQLTGARAGLAGARAALRAAKDHARDVVRPAVSAAAAEAEAKIRALYPAAGDGSLFAGDPLLPGDGGGLFWATFNAVRDQQGTAHARVLDARAKRRPAELRFRRWDGTGTVTAQLQRPMGGRAVISFAAVCDQDLTGVPVAWQVSGDGAAQVSVTSKCTRDAETGRHVWETAVVNEGDAGADVTCAANLSPLLDAGAEVTVNRDDPVPLFLGEDGTLTWAGALKGGLPFRTRHVLGDTAGPWRNVALLQPAAPGDMPRGNQRMPRSPYLDAAPLDPGTLSDKEHAAVPGHSPYLRAALRLRVGAGPAAQLVTVPFRYHRPLPEDGEVTQVQLTCRREGRRFTAYLALTVLVPAPEPRDGGRVAAVHTGWRAMSDGSLRVAVITGAAAGKPPDIRWRNERTGERQPGIIDHGTWTEVVIPAAARDLMGKARSLQGIRDRNLAAARDAVAAHLGACPGDKGVLDPDGTLAQWRSPARIARCLADAEAAGIAPGLRAALRDWARQDRHLEDWQTANEARFRRWRKNLFATVAAWVTEAADTVVTDSWDAGRRKPAPEQEDTAQEVTGRSNAVLASPGELRSAVTVAARRRGVTVREPAGGLAGVHHGCPQSPPGQLPADSRAAGVTVTCTGCRRTVDQDMVMAAAMAAGGGPAAPVQPPP